MIVSTVKLWPTREHFTLYTLHTHIRHQGMYRAWCKLYDRGIRAGPLLYAVYTTTEIHHFFLYAHATMKHDSDIVTFYDCRGIVGSASSSSGVHV